MAKNIIKFNLDAEKLYLSAADALDEGRFFDALDNINEARRLDVFNPDYKMLAGDIYFEMGLYDKALRIDMTILAMVWSLEKPNFDVVYGCIRSFLKLEEYDTAMSYLDIAFENCADFSPEVISNYTDIESLVREVASQNDFHLTDSNKDDAEIIQESKRLMRTESYELAVKYLNEIDKDSKHYLISRIMLAECEFFCGHENQSKGMMSAMLEAQPDDYLILAEAAYMFCLYSKPKYALELCKRLRNYSGHNLEILYRIGRACAYNGDFVESLTRVDECLADSPYETDLLLMRAMATSNLQDWTEAQRALLAVLTIDPYETLAVYYNERIQEKLPIPVDYLNLPKEEILRRLSFVADLAAMERKNYLTACEKNYNIALIRWAILNEYLPASEEFDILLALSDSPQCEFLFRELASERHVPIQIRNLIVAVMILSWSSDICLCVNDVIRKLDCKLPSNARSNEIYIQAWAFALASMSRCAISFEKPLRSLFSKLIQSGYVPDCNAKELAAVIIRILIEKYSSSIEILTMNGALVGLDVDFEILQKISLRLLPALIKARIVNEEQDKNETF